jgi:hypothetical protein
MRALSDQLARTGDRKPPQWTMDHGLRIARRVVAEIAF